MEITTNTYKHCDLVKVVGRVDSSTSPQFQEALAKLNESGHYKIVLDLSGVDYISSSGLWVLINVQKNCKRYNRGEVVLSGVTERIRSALDLAGFVPFFKFYDDVTSAVGNF
jgi:anti-sigma B factor antagonist